MSSGGGIVNVSGYPRTLGFLGGSELPLPRNEKILVLPFGVAGKLGVDLNKLPLFRLEVVGCRTLWVLLEPVKVQELFYCKGMILAQGQGPQDHAREESSLSVRRQLVGGQVKKAE
jgi:hypothetical protein